MLRILKERVRRLFSMRSSQESLISCRYLDISIAYLISIASSSKKPLQRCLFFLSTNASHVQRSNSCDICARHNRWFRYSPRSSYLRWSTANQKEKRISSSSVDVPVSVPSSLDCSHPIVLGDPRRGVVTSALRESHVSTKPAYTAAL